MRTLTFAAGVVFGMVTGVVTMSLAAASSPRRSSDDAELRDLIERWRKPQRAPRTVPLARRQHPFQHPAA